MSHFQLQKLIELIKDESINSADIEKFEGRLQEIFIRELESAHLTTSEHFFELCEIVEYERAARLDKALERVEARPVLEVKDRQYLEALGQFSLAKNPGLFSYIMEKGTKPKDAAEAHLLTLMRRHRDITEDIFESFVSSRWTDMTRAEVLGNALSDFYSFLVNQVVGANGEGLADPERAERLLRELQATVEGFLDRAEGKESNERKKYRDADLLPFPRKS